MSDTIEISLEMAGEIEQALNLAIGMASVHSKDSVADLIDLANSLTDVINAKEQP